MGFWNNFNKLNKQLPNTQEVLKIPSHIKQTTVNINSNRIDIRYFTNNFHDCEEFVGEITHETDIPLIIFDTKFKGAILHIQDFTYINHSKNNQLTIDISENYPYGIDKNSDLIKFDNISYYNHLKDFLSEKFLGKSKSLYYQDKKFYIPVMLNQIPLPIIRLDEADRLTPIDKKYVKKLATISQNFLRNISDVKLLQRVGNKKDTSGYVYVAILFLILGGFAGLILSAFIR